MKRRSMRGSNSRSTSAAVTKSIRPSITHRPRTDFPRCFQVVLFSLASLGLKFRVYGVPADREAEVYEKFEFLDGIFVAELNKSLSGDDAASRTNRTRR